MTQEKSLSPEKLSDELSGSRITGCEVCFSDQGSKISFWEPIYFGVLEYLIASDNVASVSVNLVSDL